MELDIYFPYNPKSVESAALLVASSKRESFTVKFSVVNEATESTILMLPLIVKSPATLR